MNGVDQRAGGPLSSSLSPLVGAVSSPGLGVPAGVAPPASATSSTCSRPWCDLPVFSRLTGRCEVHGEQDLDRLRDYLDDIGRGSFEP